MARPEPRTPLPAAVSLVTPRCVKWMWQQSSHPPKIHLENLVPTLDAIVGWSLLRGLQIFLERDNGTPTLFLSPFLSCPWVKPEIFHCSGLSLRHASLRTQSCGTNCSRHINTVRQNKEFSFLAGDLSRLVWWQKADWCASSAHSGCCSYVTWHHLHRHSLHSPGQSDHLSRGTYICGLREPFPRELQH